MKRIVKKPKKVRVNITLDEEIFEKSGNYIINLSGFFNKCLKNYIEQQQLKNLDVEDKNLLCLINKKSANKKRPFSRQEEEPIDEQYKWW